LSLTLDRLFKSIAPTKDKPYSVRAAGERKAAVAFAVAACFFPAEMPRQGNSTRWRFLI
jgi:hypothetical protein